MFHIAKSWEKNKENSYKAPAKKAGLDIMYGTAYDNNWLNNQHEKA